MRGALLAALLLPPLAAAQPVEVLRESGPSANRIDVAILGDGYTADQQARLGADARALVDGLLAFPPYLQFSRLFNVRLIHGVSAQEGAGDASDGGPRDTRYRAAYGCGGLARLLCVDTDAVAADVQAFAPETDLAVVVVNDARFGGAGGALTVTSTHPAELDILRHELAHSLAHLADEYSTPYPGYPPCPVDTDCEEPNATLHPARPGLKWGAWVEASTPLPTPASGGFGGVGAFEGGRYLASGVFRPVDTRCLMDTLDTPFCPVCTEALVLAMSSYLEWVEGPSPAGPGILACLGEPPVALAAPHLDAGPGLVFDYAWSVDGQAAAGSATRLVSPAALGPGTHPVAVEVQVSTTLVRADPRRLLRGQHAWVLEVQDCGDGGRPDAGGPPSDGGLPDAGPADAGGADGGGGGPGPGPGGCGCGQAEGSAPAALLLAALAAWRRRGAGAPG